MSTLWLICDVSGSMLEAGKRLVVRGLVRQGEQYVRLGDAAERCGATQATMWSATSTNARTEIRWPCSGQGRFKDTYHRRS